MEFLRKVWLIGGKRNSTSLRCEAKYVHLQGNLYAEDHVEEQRRLTC